MRHDLVDESQLWMHPLVLGSGSSERGTHDELEASGLQDGASGLVILTYEPDRNQWGDRS
jgi:hypothetical protein